MSEGCDGATTRLGAIGHTQSCGYVVAFEEDAGYPSGMRVVGASDNVVGVPWIHASSQAELLGEDLGQVFCSKWVDTVRSLVVRHKQACKPQTHCMAARVNRNTADVNPATRARAELVLGDEGNEVITLTLAGSNPGVYLLELEPKNGPFAAQMRRTPGLLQVADLLACVPVESDPVTSTSALCDALSACMPSYDRVMAVRFDKDDGSAEVVHETVRPGFGLRSSYSGLRFPATDVPQNARNLMKQVGARFIVDTSAAGVPMNTFHERVANLDLSGSALRASPDCHLRYLRNMGVKASLVVAIVVGNDLWGFFDFHGYSAPVHPSCEERIMVEMAATITASLIFRHEREEIARTAFALSRVLGNLHGYPSVQDFLSTEHRELLRILDIDTVVLCENSRPVNVYGNKSISLTLSECRDLIDGDELSDRVVVFKPLGGLGLAFFTMRSCVVAFLRGSIANRVAWAGKPDEARIEGEPLTPRASFDRYIKTSAARFKPWSPATVDLVKMVRHAFSSQLYAQSLPFDLQETFAQVSHELRTPFHGVVGALELLQPGRDVMETGEQQELLQSALRSASAMMSTLDDILGIAKDRNNMEANECRFTVSSPILLTISAMSPFAATGAVDLVADAIQAENDLEVFGDSRRIKSIVQNLVSNAIKFTPAGGQVRVSLVVHDSVEDATDWWAKEAGRFDAQVWMGRPSVPDSDVKGASSPRRKWYAFCVEDSGAGVRPLDLPHLATAYRQVSRGASRSHAGTGLGLHICKSYVGILDGAWGIASTFSEENIDGGTLFAVVIPLRLPEVDDPVEVDPADGTETESTVFRSWGEKIGAHKIAFLIVDDQRINIKLMARKVAQHFKDNSIDVQIFTATDGLVGLEVHTAQRKAESDGLILLAGIFVDFHMPGLDGFEYTRMIRQVEVENSWPRVTVCGYTADITESSRETFKKAGGDDMVCKPWRPGRVEGVCDAMVAKALGADQSEAGGA